MKRFTNCKYAEEGKALYKELLKKYHPDNGGSTVTMQEINSEFTEWWKTHKSRHCSATGEEYIKETQERAEDFIEILDKLAALDGLDLEICGTWLWIRGNTLLNREALKEFGCRYATSKKAWFWTSESFTKKRMKTQSMSAIRAKYGSEKIINESKPLLN